MDNRWQRKYCKMVTKPDSYICSRQGNPLKPRYTYSLNVECWEKVFHANGDRKNAGVAIFKSDKIDWNKACEMRKGRPLHSDHSVNTRRRYQITSDPSLSCVRLFTTPGIAAHQTSLSITNSQSLLKPVSTESMMPSNNIILCRPLLLLLSIFPSIRVFSNESALHIRWPKY